MSEMSKTHEVKEILRKQEITSWFQPIVDVESRELLGWEPNVKLEEGLQRTINWIQEHLEACRDGAYVV